MTNNIDMEKKIAELMAHVASLEAENNTRFAPQKFDF